MRLSYVIATPEVSSIRTAWIGSAVEVLSQVADLGYAGVELQVRDPNAFDASRFLDCVLAQDLVVSGISTGPAAVLDGLSLTSADESTRLATITRLASLLRFAAEAGSHLAIGGLRGFLSSAPDPAAGMARFEASIEPVIEQASQLGVRIALEPQSRPTADFFNTIRETLRYVARYPDVLGLEIDTYHMCREERSISAAIVEASLSGSLLHVQLSDSNRLVPGLGQVNWDDVFLTLAALGFDRFLSIEILQHPDSHTCASQAKAFVEDRMRGLGIVFGSHQGSPYTNSTDHRLTTGNQPYIPLNPR